jgi:hypothetical protein
MTATNNLRLVTKEWDKFKKNVDVSARKARDEMMTSMIQLAKEEIKGKRPKGQKAWTGKPTPPMNRTGDLRASIRGEKYNLGFANYKAIVGPTIVYGRQVEMGGGNWKKGVRFPYMEPAWEKFRTQVHSQIVRKYFGKGSR